MQIFEAGNHCFSSFSLMGTLLPCSGEVVLCPDGNAAVSPLPVRWILISCASGQKQTLPPSLLAGILHSKKKKTSTKLGLLKTKTKPRVCRLVQQLCFLLVLLCIPSLHSSACGSTGGVCFPCAAKAAVWTQNRRWNKTKQTKKGRSDRPLTQRRQSHLTSLPATTIRAIRLKSQA